MRSTIKPLSLLLFLCFSYVSMAQDYFYEDKGPFDQNIQSPEAYLGYPIGEQHTRHDQIVAYLTYLANQSDKASIEEYGRTHENRKLVILRVSTAENLRNIESLRTAHLEYVNPSKSPSDYDGLPAFINLGYNVHGNEPSSSEAAMLTAYTLIASNSSEVQNYLQNSIIFIDPTINPDGRDRHTQWANQFKAKQLVSNGAEAEHNEAWPRGRTNHYWFDLNRDWLLAVHPESQGKLNWYHQWYPNVVTDFHEMGTRSHYFFEPMKPIGSKDPIMPKENYTELNDLFANYFVEALDEIGSLYYTKESFDGTYPGYGSSYPDLQGALALLFEQASSRGHLQDTHYGTISFAFTIRNQYKSSIATIKAAVENKGTLRKYQQDFFKSALNEGAPTGFAAYEFGDDYDQSRNREFLKFLLKHKIEVYKNGNKYRVPLKQPQRRMVQTMFETYNEYRDSVFYDASAWSVANFYNLPYRGLSRFSQSGNPISEVTKPLAAPATKTEYSYILDWDDYYAPAALYHMQRKGLKVEVAFKPFSIMTNSGLKSFNYGSVLIPVSLQDESPDKVAEIVNEAQEKFRVPIFSTQTGFSDSGIDLGSNNFRGVNKPKAALIIGDGVSSYEAGEVWHLMDTRVHMPIAKIQLRTFRNANLDDFNTMVMVSGSYSQLDSVQVKRIKDWVSKGNTLITIARASSWAINKKLVKEQLTKKPKVKDSSKAKAPERLRFVDASEHLGRERLGGAIFEVDLDITHPLGFGYRRTKLPVYKNNNVFIQPSKNAYATVAKYTSDPHIDGFISDDNLNIFLKPSASLIVSRLGRGRVVLFADNPNFRGAWYGTNRLFLNAIFLGNRITVPTPRP